MTRRLTGFLLSAFLAATPLRAQIPDTFTNLQVLPSDITRDSLVQIMRGFSFALGVRCQYCHVGGDGISFEGVEFARDDDEDKRKARFMMRMVANLNRYVFPLMPERDSPPIDIECKTCHRGNARPILLRQELLQITHETSADSAAERYRALREAIPMRGRYDFGQWETNTLAEELEREGRPRDAITIYELNREFYPDSYAIAINLARLYEEVGERAKAIAGYESALELRPDSDTARTRLEALRGG